MHPGKLSASELVAALGGLLLGLVENYASALFGSNWRDFVAFVALIVLLMFRPTGLFGERVGA